MRIAVSVTSECGGWWIDERWRWDGMLIIRTKSKEISFDAAATPIITNHAFYVTHS